MLEITYKVRKRLTQSEILLFTKIADYILGEKFDLSLVICTDKISDHNVLAYPLSKADGEIFLNPSQKGEFALPYLLLHACVHLLGYKHGKKMDTIENKFLKKLNLTKKNTG